MVMRLVPFSFWHKGIWVFAFGHDTTPAGLKEFYGRSKIRRQSVVLSGL